METKVKSNSNEKQRRSRVDPSMVKEEVKAEQASACKGKRKSGQKITRGGGTLAVKQKEENLSNKNICKGGKTTAKGMRGGGEAAEVQGRGLTVAGGGAEVKEKWQWQEETMGPRHG